MEEDNHLSQKFKIYYGTERHLVSHGWTWETAVIGEPSCRSFFTLFKYFICALSTDCFHNLKKKLNHIHFEKKNHLERNYNKENARVK